MIVKRKREREGGGKINYYSTQRVEDVHFLFNTKLLSAREESLHARFHGGNRRNGASLIPPRSIGTHRKVGRIRKWTDAQIFNRDLLAADETSSAARYIQQNTEIPLLVFPSRVSCQSELPRRGSGRSIKEASLIRTTDHLLTNESRENDRRSRCARRAHEEKERRTVPDQYDRHEIFLYRRAETGRRSSVRR